MVGTRPPHDDFDVYFAEKIWSLIPEIHRHEDGRAEPAGQLRALVVILAEQAAIARRDIDRLLADTRIEEADDWAVAYIGQLLGTRLLSPLNTAGRRADVGHTIAYRRRAGTPRLLETLADDIADWDAVAQEAFQHLFRYPHGLDREFPVGPVTHTPLWGFPDLRRTRIGDVIGGPFEDLAYRPEFRPGRGVRGRYNIPKVNLFCFRKYAYPLVGVTPFRFDATHYALDPSGRGNLTLFQLGGFEEPECHKPSEWDVRAPITCRRLNAVRYRLPLASSNGGLNWDRMAERTFESQEAFLEAANVAAVGDLPGLLAAALDPDCPKARLLAHPGNAVPSITVATGAGAPLPPHAIAGADLGGWADGAITSAFIEALVDPARGLVQFVRPAGGPAAFEARLIHYGIFLPVGAGGHPRRERVPDVAPPPIASTNPVFSNLAGDRMFGDCRTYTPTTAANRIDVNADARLWAADGQRPYVILRPAPNGAEIEIRATVPGVDLELSGVWLGAVLRGTATGGTLATLRLTGSFGRIALVDMTLDPGGEQAALVGDPVIVIPHLRLVIDGQVGELVIDRCILGSVHEAAGASGASLACTAAKVEIKDSILLPHGLDPVLQLYGSEVTIKACTILGECRLGRAEISDTIIDGRLEVQDAQGSCLRFSMVRSGGRIPSPFESVILPQGLPAGSFESVRFGDSGLCVLTAAAPGSVAEGGENRTEMGVFNRALFPIKRADLTAKIAEFSPIQAVVQLVMAT